MGLLHAVPRRCINLPPGTLRVLGECLVHRTVQSGTAITAFQQRFADWLGVPYAYGTATGRTAFQLALEALDVAPGAEIIFPALTFPVIPMVAQMLGYRPVFCDVDPTTYNAGPEHIAPQITARTGAIVATHLFGQPCPIQGVRRARGWTSGRHLRRCRSV
jgi:dTDP-4-amino-4,6-dideoxygalactose transaminase